MYIYTTTVKSPVLLLKFDKIIGVHIYLLYCFNQIINTACTVRHKFLTGENIDEFPAIRQYFPYQNFPFS